MAFLVIVAGRSSPVLGVTSDPLTPAPKLAPHRSDRDRRALPLTATVAVEDSLAHGVL